MIPSDRNVETLRLEMSVKGSRITPSETKWGFKSRFATTALLLGPSVNMEELCEISAEKLNASFLLRRIGLTDPSADCEFISSLKSDDGSPRMLVQPLLWLVQHWLLFGCTYWQRSNRPPATQLKIDLEAEFVSGDESVNSLLQTLAHA
eukprot:70862-Amphidinium_carterae.1